MPLELEQNDKEEIRAKIAGELHMVGLEHFGEPIAQRVKLIEVPAARFNNSSCCGSTLGRAPR